MTDQDQTVEPEKTKERSVSFHPATEVGTGEMGTGVSLEEGTSVVPSCVGDDRRCITTPV